jgi:hypothetical protein
MQNIDRKMSFVGGVGSGWMWGSSWLEGSTIVLLLAGATDCFTATYILKKARISSSV